MKVMIDIPKEFERDLQDKFNEFCSRVIEDINCALDNDEPLLCGDYERETAEMFLKAFEKATVIPDDATKGEVFMSMFPDAEVDRVSEDTVHLKDMWRNPLMFVQIPLTIWNAPYMKGNEE